MTTTFETAQVGDRVWCMYHGKWMTITDIVRGDTYPIKTDINSYTMEGKLNKESVRTLFWDEVVITPPPKPLPHLEVDTKVIVWNKDSDKKQRRYFSHFDSNNAICVFVLGGTSWTTTQTLDYLHWKLAKD